MVEKIHYEYNHLCDTLKAERSINNKCARWSKLNCNITIEPITAIRRAKFMQLFRPIKEPRKLVQSAKFSSEQRPGKP